MRLVGFVPVLGVVSLLSCSGPLRVFDGASESALPPARSALWQELAARRSDDWFHLLNLGEEALDWRLRAIDSATASVDLQTFLWDRDPVGDSILRRLLAAGDRGVRVRILLDDSFLLREDDVLRAIDSHPNIAMRIFNPYGRRGGRAAVRLLMNLGDFAKLDHRMHNKSMVIDNRVAIVGGRNLADDYFGYDPKMNFRDMEVLTGGPGVRTLSRGFDQYWNNHWTVPVSRLASGAAPESALPALRRSIARAPGTPGPQSPGARGEAWLLACSTAAAGRPELLLDRPPSGTPGSPGQAPVQVARRLTRALDEARREIILVSAYFIPTPELEQAIERAESRGVQVRILTNSLRSNNHTTAHSAYRHHLKRLVSHGADLHEVNASARDRQRYMRGPVGGRTLGLHAKVLVIDRDLVFVGSANLDSRSLRINTEMGLLIESRALNEQVRKALAPDFLPRNSWHVRFDSRGNFVWVGEGSTRKSQPAASAMQRLEDWFFAFLPIEGEM